MHKMVDQPVHKENMIAGPRKEEKKKLTQNEIGENTCNNGGFRRNVKGMT